MKRALTIAILFAASLPAVAGTGEAYAIGFGAGIAFKLIPFTNRHVVMPATRAIQRTVRPVAQDAVERANRKAEKAQRKEEKARRKAERQQPRD